MWENLIFLFILLNPSFFLLWFYSILDHFVLKLTAILTILINASVTLLTAISAFFLTKTGLKKIFSAKIFLAVKYYDIFGFGPIILRASPDKEFYLNIFLNLYYKFLGNLIK